MRGAQSLEHRREVSRKAAVPIAVGDALVGLAPRGEGERVAGRERRVDVDEVDLAGERREERARRVEVVALDQQAAVFAGRAADPFARLERRG